MLFRYPGGKTKVAKIICDKIKEMYIANNCEEFVEPFFGSGAITFQLAKDGFFTPDRSNVWLNDIDAGIASIWTAVAEFPELLVQKYMNMSLVLMIFMLLRSI